MLESDEANAKIERRRRTTNTTTGSDIMIDGADGVSEEAFHANFGRSIRIRVPNSPKLPVGVSLGWTTASECRNWIEGRSWIEKQPLPSDSRPARGHSKEKSKALVALCQIVFVLFLPLDRRHYHIVVQSVCPGPFCASLSLACSPRLGPPFLLPLLCTHARVPAPALPLCAPAAAAAVGAAALSLLLLLLGCCCRLVAATTKSN